MQGLLTLIKTDERLSPVAQALNEQRLLLSLEAT
jgi:hypothetical protein